MIQEFISIIYLFGLYLYDVINLLSFNLIGEKKVDLLKDMVLVSVDIDGHILIYVDQLIYCNLTSMKTLKIPKKCKKVIIS